MRIHADPDPQHCLAVCNMTGKLFLGYFLARPLYTRNYRLPVTGSEIQLFRYSPSGSVLSFLLGGVRAGDISSLQSMLLVVVLVLLLLPSRHRMDKFLTINAPVV
jgi:hypothetical protein